MNENQQIAAIKKEAKQRIKNFKQKQKAQVKNIKRADKGFKKYINSKSADPKFDNKQAINQHDIDVEKQYKDLKTELVKFITETNKWKENEIKQVKTKNKKLAKSKTKSKSVKVDKKAKKQQLERIASELTHPTKKSRQLEPHVSKRPTVVEVKNFDFFYNKGKKQSLFNINMEIKENTITTFIGPSGCGKSTLLRSINRMNDLVDGSQSSGEIDVFGKNIYAEGYDVTQLRTDVGMVFQKANPFPGSIYDNVAYGPKSQGVTDKKVLDELVIDALKKAALWDEVGENLNGNAAGLSGGQQQRLCIARAIAMHPKILLMDEPTSALDPIATVKVEQLVQKLKKDYTIIMVTHSMSQAKRISDFTGFFLKGELIEFDRTKKMFINPKDPRTEEYISGRYGG